MWVLIGEMKGDGDDRLPRYRDVVAVSKDKTKLERYRDEFSKRSHEYVEFGIEEVLEVSDGVPALNCEILRRVQWQLDDPDMPSVTIPPGTYDVYTTIRVPSGKRLTSPHPGAVKLIGHSTPVIEVVNPYVENPVSNLIIEV